MQNRNDISSLIAAAKAGESESKNQLLGYYRDYLRLLARLHVRPLLKAKFAESDIVQETCMQALVDFDQFRGGSEKQFAAWLRTILANKGAWMARKYHTEKRDARLELDLQHHIDQSSVNVQKGEGDSKSDSSARSLLLRSLTEAPWHRGHDDD